MLIGARDPAAMTADQRAVYDGIASGPRKGVPFPFLAMLDVPQLAEAIQAVGAAIRFSGAASEMLREVATLASAAAFGSGYEWDYHVAIARRIAMPESVITAAATGLLGGIDDPATRATIGLCRAAVLEQKIPQADLAMLVSAVGRPAASEIVAISGYYPLLALFLSAGDIDHPLVAAAAE
jgi:4-carboxymuconolactone decarboxylase